MYVKNNLSMNISATTLFVILVLNHLTIFCYPIIDFLIKEHTYSCITIVPIISLDSLINCLSTLLIEHSILLVKLGYF